MTKKQNEFGGITTYKYDAAGNLIEEDLPPVQGNGRNPRVVKYRYDAAGRLRATIQEGAQPVFTATDYFLPGASPANFVRHGRMDSAPLDVVEEEKGSGVFISPSLGFPGGNRQGVHFGVMAQL